MSQRVALITGANRGIGAVIARQLHADGWALSLGMRTPERPSWDDTGACHLFAYDAEAVTETAWVAEARERFGRIDAVIPCAGIMIPKTIMAADDADIDQLMAINVKAPRRLVHAAWTDLAAARQGRVIMLASLSGKRVKTAASGLYSVSKFAVVALAHAIRQEGWDQGIRATAVCPGFVATDMARAITDIDIERMTPPESIAAATTMLLDLPNNASVAEFHVNCMLEARF